MTAKGFVTKVVESLYTDAQTAAQNKDQITGQALITQNKDEVGNTLATFYLGKNKNESAKNDKV